MDRKKILFGVAALTALTLKIGFSFITFRYIKNKYFNKKQDQSKELENKPENNKDQDNNNNSNPSNSFPIIDLSINRSRETIINEISNACKTFGFFIVINHGVDTQLMKDVFTQSKNFFDLPEETKKKYLVNKGNRGYNPLFDETLDPENQTSGDTKEGFYIGVEEDPNDVEGKTNHKFKSTNQWPSEVPLFKEKVLEYFNCLSKLGFYLSSLLSASLGLDGAENLTNIPGNFDDPMKFINLLHYIPIKSKPQEGLFGAGAHTDYGMLTMLLTDGQPGLQIFYNQKWIDVPIVPDSFVINIGDAMARWTNGIYKSTLHRVALDGTKHRYSIPFFFEPNFNCVVSPLSSCVSESNPRRYEPMTAGDYLTSRYMATHKIFKEINSKE